MRPHPTTINASGGRVSAAALGAALLLACPTDPRPRPCQRSDDCPPYSYCDPQLERCRSYDPELGRCGDGILDLRRGEQCDDGNQTGGDGCGAGCLIETPTTCGDGVIDYRNGEQCDDGQQCDNGRSCLRNTQCLGIVSGRCGQRDGDGCSAACQIEPPASCGDEALDLVTGEACDDGRQCEDRRPCRSPTDCAGIGSATCAPRSGDGCSAACRLEPVSPTCGDGVVDPGERCDNGHRCSDGQPCAVDANCAGIGDERCHLRNGDVCDSWSSSDICSCQPACDCNFTCELSATTRHLAGQPGVDGAQDGTGSAAQIGSGGGALVVTGGLLYLADISNHSIRSIDPVSAEVRTIAGDIAGNSGYQDAADNGLGARFNLRCDSDSGAGGGMATDGRFLYVGDCGNHVVRSVELAIPHGVRTIAGRRYRAWDAASYGLCVGKDDQTGLCYLDHSDPAQAEFATLNGLSHDRGMLYLVDIDYHTLRRLDLATAAVTTLAGQPGVSADEQDPSIIDGFGAAALLQEPRAVVADGAGFVYLGERHSLRRINLRTLEVRTLFNGWASIDGTPAEAGTIFPIALASDGISIYFAEEVMQTVRQLHLPSGTVTTVAGLPVQNNCAGEYVEGTGNAARFSCLSGLALESRSRTLFVVDTGNSVVRQIK